MRSLHLNKQINAGLLCKEKKADTYPLIGKDYVCCERYKSRFCY